MAIASRNLDLLDTFHGQKKSIWALTKTLITPLNLDIFTTVKASITLAITPKMWTFRTFLMRKKHRFEHYQKLWRSHLPLNFNIFITIKAPIILAITPKFGCFSAIFMDKKRPFGAQRKPWPYILTSCFYYRLQKQTERLAVSEKTVVRRTLINRGGRSVLRCRFVQL